MSAVPAPDARPSPLTVDEALARILAGVKPTQAQSAPIFDARGRTLAETLVARLTQPPFDASAMDGYAVRAGDLAALPARLTVIGEAAAGHPFSGAVAPGEAVRIFTGAPLPAGTDAVVIQENTARDGPTVIVRDGTPDRDHVRKRGADFEAGAALLGPGRLLGARELSLAAAMGHGTVAVRRKPRVCVLASGDELVHPGELPKAGQIVASNHLGVAVLAERAGAEVELLGIARDTRESLIEAIAKADGADILVTIGGASVGDHDLVSPTLQARGMTLAFWNIAMRPGKPLMFGTLGPGNATRLLGLPGNPVSALVCARIFLVPLIKALLGQPAVREGTRAAHTTVAIPANGPREHYMRATLTTGPDGTLLATPVPSQDSALLAPLATADVLIVFPAKAAALPAGSEVRILPLDL